MRLRGLPRKAVESAWFDPTLAAVICALSETEFLGGYPHRHGSTVGLAILTFAMTSALAWRRRAPLMFVLWVCLFEAVIGFRFASIADSQASAWLLIIVPYTAASLLPRDRALLALSVALAVSLAMGFVWSSSAVADSFFVTAIVLLSAGLGRTVRSQRALDRVLRHSAECLAAEREDHVRMAVADERSRIARELHAVVANSVSAMVVQAAAAQRLVADRDVRADETMEAIERAGRETIGDLRRMLGMLRRGAADLPLEPQPGVGRLHELAERARSRGGRVSLSVAGEPSALASGVEISIYRITEDALASAAPETSTNVRLSYREHAVELMIVGCEEPRTAWPTAAMNERVNLCHGSIERRKATQGAVRLTVTLPSVPPMAPEATPTSDGVEADNGRQLVPADVASPGLMTPSS